MSISATASLACQRAVYTALNGLLTDPTTNATVPVYDEPPETAGFPYVQLGPCITTPQNRFGRRGRMALFQIDVWGRSGPDAAQSGWYESKMIAGQIEELLDWTQPESSDGWDFVDCQFHRSHEKTEADGITRHLILEYQMLLEVTTAP